jgi:hypothetical protein
MLKYVRQLCATLYMQTVTLDIELKRTDYRVYYTHITWNCTCGMRPLMIPAMLMSEV